MLMQQLIFGQIYRCYDSLENFTDEPKLKNEFHYLPDNEKSDLLLNAVVNKHVLPEDIGFDLSGKKFKCQV